MNDAPIGIFDSGLGGLTVARAVIDRLPGEDILYLGDTAHTPYGPRPIDEVRELTLAGLDVLAERGVKLLVIACNTAAAAALPQAYERYWEGQGIPVVEVISPAASEAIRATKNGHVGVIGTKGTVDSGAYQRALGKGPDLDVTQQACPRFVEFVENGTTTGDELLQVARDYLAPLQEQEVDTVVLGCTHYPLLSGVISYVMGPEVRLVSSSHATSNSVYSELTERGLLHSPRGPEEETDYTFLVTSPSPNFKSLARRFLGPEVKQIESVEAS